MRRKVELQIITEALSKLGPHAPAARVWGRALGASDDTGASGNLWAADIDDLALHICTRLFGRPDDTPESSPLVQAADAKRGRDLGGLLGALMAADQELTSAPWYPVRPGDLVHVHYSRERAGQTPTPAFGETYVISDAGKPGDAVGGLLDMQLLAHTLPDTIDGAEGLTGCFAVEAADDPIYEVWFEAGPHLLTIVRDGQVVHDGAVRRVGGVAAAGLMLQTFAQTVSEAEHYLERGEPTLALARLRSDRPLPLCASPGVMPEHADCARPRGHGGAHSPDADLVDPPHECPALPEQLHAVVTVGAAVEEVHFAGLYEDQAAAADHAAGFVAYDESLNARYVKPAPFMPGEMLLELPEKNEYLIGVQLAVVVPLPVLHGPWDDDESIDSDMDADHGKDLDDEDDHDRGGE